MVGSSRVGRAGDDVTTELLSICAAIDVITERDETTTTVNLVHLIVMIVVLINTSSSNCNDIHCTHDAHCTVNM